MGIIHAKEGLDKPLFSLIKHLRQFYDFTRFINESIFVMIYDLDILDDTVKKIDDVEQEVEQLFRQAQHIETVGLTATDLKILQKNNLLNGTALEYFIPELFNDSYFDNHESDIALEALSTKIKDKMIEWSAKILSFIKNLQTKITKALGDLWQTLEERLSSLTQMAWDKTKALNEEIKVHPYKTAALVVASIVAVAAIIAFTGPALSTGKDALSNLTLRLKAALDAFKSPIMTVSTQVSESGVLKATVDSVTNVEAVTATASKLSWSQTAVKLLMNQLKAAWRQIVSGIGVIGSKAIGLIKWVNATGGDGPKILGEKIAEKTGSKLLGWAVHKPLEKAYLAALWSILGIIGLLLYKVLNKSFVFLKQVFKPLEKLTKSS